MTTTTYTIKQHHGINFGYLLMAFVTEMADNSNEMFGSNYKWTFPLFQRYAHFGRVMVCYRDENPVGMMLSTLRKSTFDCSMKILYQDLLYARPGTRAAYLLMQEFIDFGKSNADHIITMIGAGTNIKRQSLEKLGFKKIEELYRIEV